MTDIKLEERVRVLEATLNAVRKQAYPPNGSGLSPVELVYTMVAIAEEGLKKSHDIDNLPPVAFC